MTALTAEARDGLIDWLKRNLKHFDSYHTPKWVDKLDWDEWPTIELRSHESISRRTELWLYGQEDLH